MLNSGEQKSKKSSAFEEALNKALCMEKECFTDTNQGSSVVKPTGVTIKETITHTECHSDKTHLPSEQADVKCRVDHLTQMVEKSLPTSIGNKSSPELDGYRVTGSYASKSLKLVESRVHKFESLGTRQSALIRSRRRIYENNEEESFTSYVRKEAVEIPSSTCVGQRVSVFENGAKVEQGNSDALNKACESATVSCSSEHGSQNSKPIPDAVSIGGSNFTEDIVADKNEPQAVTTSTLEDDQQALVTNQAVEAKQACETQSQGGSASNANQKQGQNIISHPAYQNPEIITNRLPDVSVNQDLLRDESDETINPGMQKEIIPNITIVGETCLIARSQPSTCIKPVKVEYYDPAQSQDTEMQVASNVADTCTNISKSQNNQREKEMSKADEDIFIGKRLEEALGTGLIDGHHEDHLQQAGPYSTTKSIKTNFYRINSTMNSEDLSVDSVSSVAQEHSSIISKLDGKQPFLHDKVDNQIEGVPSNSNRGVYIDSSTKLEDIKYLQKCLSGDSVGPEYLEDVQGSYKVVDLTKTGEVHKIHLKGSKRSEDMLNNESQEDTKESISTIIEEPVERTVVYQEIEQEEVTPSFFTRIMSIITCGYFASTSK